MQGILKKAAGLCGCAAILLFLASVRVGAAEIVGESVYTDIIASINDYNIASFNLDGNTVVVAEDLRNYGFDVVWSSEARTLSISRNGSNNVASTYIAPKIPKVLVGTKANDVLKTDIQTYINGNWVPSFNIDGQTVLRFDALNVFGNVSYDNSIRRLRLDIRDGLNYKISPPSLMPGDNPSAIPNGLYFKLDSANGVRVRWSALNNTNKTINYYTTTYYMYNPVGDPAYDIVSGQSYFERRLVGPVYPGEWLVNFTGQNDLPPAYSSLCEAVVLDTIKLEYSDGTSEIIYYGGYGERQDGSGVL